MLYSGEPKHRGQTTHIDRHAVLGYVHRHLSLAVSSLHRCIRGAQLQGPAGQADQVPAGGMKGRGEGGGHKAVMVVLHASTVRLQEAKSGRQLCSYAVVSCAQSR